MILALLLAQTTEPVSHSSIGTYVVITVLLTKWYWDYKRQAREEDERKEPKSNPPLHERFISRPEYQADQEKVDERLNAATASRKSMHKDIEAHGHRLASLEKGEQHTAASLANLDRKIDVLLSRTPRSS